MLSRNGVPRWFLPAGERHLDSVLAAWSPYRLQSRLNWHAVRMANRIGSLSLLPATATATVAAFDCIDWKSVGWTADNPPVTAVYVGTPGKSRKAVIHLLDRDSGACEAVLKIPINCGARAAILREAARLLTLAAEGRSVAPRLLSLNRDRGISTQTFLPGEPGSRRFLPEYLRLFLSLRLPDEMTCLAEHAANLQDHLLSLASSDRDLAPVTAVLAQLSDADPLPSFWVHGDFAPWNIKHHASGSALLDWEDARRAGLPLQDALHFFHIQDYLFDRRPTSHVGEVRPLAREIGLTGSQCHKLEIAYLVHSYLQRLTLLQTNHSDFLLNTLKLVLRDGLRDEVPNVVRRNPPPPERTPSPASLRIRSDLFSTVIAEFNLAKLPYCILSGYEEYPEQIPSDMDFMVRPVDMPRVSTLLIRAAERCGARLLQSIQHETTACYFVLAKDDGRQLGFFNPDCCSDYRRQGRLWLRADDILANRQPFKNFYVPSVPDEFMYYLIKKILKQSFDAGQVQRLYGLYKREPQGCRDRLRRFWSTRTAAALEQAVVEQDLSWFASNNKLLLSELNAARPVEPPLNRFAAGLRGVAGFVRRVLQPTGMFVIVCGENEAYIRGIAAALRQSLKPAFRWTRALQVPSSRSFPRLGNDVHGSGFSRNPKILTLCQLALTIRLARVRSTLTICAANHSDLVAGSGHRVSSMFRRLMLHSDLVLVLISGGAASSTAPSQQCVLPASLRRCPVAYLNGSQSMEDSVYQGSTVILQWMSTRQVRRLDKKLLLWRSSSSSPARTQRVCPLEAD